VQDKIEESKKDESQATKANQNSKGSGQKNSSLPQIVEVQSSKAEVSAK
jgi:hypothetical protein